MKVYSQKAQARITEKHFQFDPSFGPYIDCLRNMMDESTDIVAKFYRYLIKKFQQHPYLLVPFKNVEILEDHDELIQLLKMSLLPLSDHSGNIQMALAFMQPSCLFYYTPSFKKHFIDERVEFDTAEDEVSNLRYFVKLVLKQCYDIEIECPDNLKEVKNPDTGSSAYYRLNIDSRFIQVHCITELPVFEDHWREILSVGDDDFFRLFKTFPSQSFKLEGFCLFSVEDVSKEMALNQVKDAILNMHTVELNKTIQAVESAIGELLGDSTIKIAITPFFKINGRVVFNKSLHVKCLKIFPGENSLENGISLEDIYHKLSESSKPYIFSNFDKEFVISRSSLSDLQKLEIKNYLVYPITTVRDGLMGIFELEKANITSATIDVLQPALALITDLVYYMIELFENRINKLVKEKFTPLLQSVEWKFNEVAWEYLRDEGEENVDETIGNVIFKNVFPFYGAVDIRDSSVERNIALKNDYINQMTATLELLLKTSSQVSLPLLDGLQFKCQRFINLLNELLTSETEMKINKFLNNEVLVFFKYLQERYPVFVKDIEGYFQKMNRDKGEFRNYLRAYESSVQKINRSIVTYFDEEIERLQQVFPFYYEKYRTDGVEYNIYLGQSIVPHEHFDNIYLGNLKLWQINSMAHIAQLNHSMISVLPVPLKTTQLILVHNLPIDISFRKDERRFDVEGSYNIRYEILKKRIDKVRIKNTLERLTQPDKIALVYSTSTEVEEYVQHINFLQSKGILTDTIENLDLENLQGISGLKALRVGVNTEIQSNVLV